MDFRGKKILGSCFRTCLKTACGRSFSKLLIIVMSSILARLPRLCTLWAKNPPSGAIYACSISQVVSCSLSCPNMWTVLRPWTMLTGSIFTRDVTSRLRLFTCSLLFRVNVDSGFFSVLNTYFLFVKSFKLCFSFYIS